MIKTKQRKSAQQSVPPVEEIACYPLDGYGYFDDSEEWGKKLINLWIKTKRAYVEEGIANAELFKTELQRAILEEIDIEDAFAQGCAEIGVDGDQLFGGPVYDQYFDRQLARAFSSIPSHLHAELCWIPEWDGHCLDTLMDTHGLKSEHYRSNYLEDVLPGDWLRLFLQMVNCSSVDLIGAAIEEQGEVGRVLAQKCAQANFKVSKDQNRPQLLTASQVITAIENAYTYAIPMFHFEVNVRALFEAAPELPMKMATVKGQVHVGFHQPVNGAGYMDTYAGEVVIPANAIGFAGADRWSYGINRTYGLVRSYFYTTPVSISGN